MVTLQYAEKINLSYILLSCTRQVVQLLHLFNKLLSRCNEPLKTSVEGDQALQCSVLIRKFCKRPKEIYFTSITNWSNTFRETSITTFDFGAKCVTGEEQLKRSLRRLLWLCSIKIEDKSTMQRVKTAGVKDYPSSALTQCARAEVTLYVKDDKNKFFWTSFQLILTLFSFSLLAAYLIMIKLLKYTEKGWSSCRETVFSHLNKIGQLLKILLK